ncbi:histone deacetylase 8-like protein, partial [Ascoidea rubescens DSM 1968]
ILNLLPSNRNRLSMVMSLIKAFELDQYFKQIQVKNTNKVELCKFHDKDYINFLLMERVDIDSDFDSLSDDDDDDDDSIIHDHELYDTDKKRLILKHYGLIYDSPLFPFLPEYVKILGGSTLQCAKWIINKYKKNEKSQIIGVNWIGGRHHGKKSKAAGFCYINDINLGIIKLRTMFPKIVYIDFDLHYGDGVSQAFQFSQNVLTISLHRFDGRFFYPGTGGLHEQGKGPGLEYMVNLPLNKGLNDESLLKLYNEIIEPTVKRYRPNIMVIQFGCDGHFSDEHKQWNLTYKGYGDVLEKLIELKINMMVLGGGGYNNKSVSKCWTYLTAIIAGKRLEADKDWDLIPDHEYIEEYEKDSFMFW